jgi:hypothetical protein
MQRACDPAEGHAHPESSARVARGLMPLAEGNFFVPIIQEIEERALSVLRLSIVHGFERRCEDSSISNANVRRYRLRRHTHRLLVPIGTAAPRREKDGAGPPRKTNVSGHVP